MLNKKSEHKEISEKYSEELIEIIHHIAPDKRLLREFFEDLCTPAEYRGISLRWQIVKQLDAGVFQRDVAENLHTAIATVSRGSRELLNANGGFRKVLDKLSKK